MKTQVFVEKLLRKKTDGTEILVPLQPSNLMITELGKADDRRIKTKKTEKKEKVKKDGK